MINYNRLGYEIKRDLANFRCPRREYRGNQKRIFYCGNCRAFTKRKNATPCLRKGLFGGRKRVYQCNTRESTMLEIIVCTFRKELCPNT